MCNLYHLSPKDQVGTFFRSIPPEDYTAVPVGPFGLGMFLRPGPDGELEVVRGQWGMIEPTSRTRRPTSRAILTNNARAESIDSRKTYRDAWKAGHRCLIPAGWYQEPNWETGKNIWWRMRRADEVPWALAGIWSEWTDPDSGEIVPNYTMITVNCDSHPLLNRLHKPEPKLPDDAQDKRAVVQIEREHWDTWLHGDEAAARALLAPAPAGVFDLTDALQTDERLAAMGLETGRS